MEVSVLNPVERETLLESWIAQYGDAVLRTCYLMLADRAQAEDAVQDTFLRAWRFMDRYEGRGERAWLMAIALNVCREHCRSRWRRHIDLTRALEDLPPSALGILPEDRLLFTDILRLPPPYKRVLILYYYQHMTLEETAQTLGLRRSTAHHRLKRAEDMLRKKLTGGESHD